MSWRSGQIADTDVRLSEQARFTERRISAAVKWIYDFYGDIVLTDLLAENLRIVFCGTAAGETSAALGQYYAGPTNKFWRILWETGLTPCQLEPADYRQLLSYGLGLTDVVKQQSGRDSSLDFSGAKPNDVESNIIRFCPRVLCFNGKRAAMIYLKRRRIDYGFQSENIGSTRVFVAPSTSGLAAKYWDATIWRELAEYVIE